MRILLTNSTLNARGGTQSFGRDLARGLQALGHSVIAYTSDLTHQERLLENDVMAVATDLARLPFKPDVIHAQHHLDAMSALAAMPGVPAIYHCHGATWLGAVPKHPRIRRYLAVSMTGAERMAVESNIPPAEITVLLNGVDLARFRSVRRLPSRPARALFFNSRHTEDSETVAAIREATARQGLSLDFVGRHIGVMTDRPEAILPEYDIVFASGLSAIEALASGCAVIVIGRTGCGELVRAGNFDRYRQTNFAVAVNAVPPSADAVAAEIGRYSATETAAISERLREEGDFRHVVRRLAGLYEETIARHQTVTPDPAAEMRAVAQYLRRIVPLIKMTDRMLDGQWASPTRATSFEELRAELALLQKRLELTEQAAHGTSVP